MTKIHCLLMYSGKWLFNLTLVTTAIIIAGCTENIPAPMKVAHRGASHDAPENTIPAFMLAWEQGADAIEGDFFLTKDGEIVCIHDANTKRVSGRDIFVGDATLEELRDVDVGRWKGDQWEGTGIPTIGEVFDLVPRNKKIFVEIKSGTVILPRLYEEIDRSRLSADQIVIISFHSDVIREFKLSRPEHKAFWLSGLRKNENGNIVPEIETVLETLEKTGADGFSSHYGLAGREYIDKVTREGYEYHVWTVNDPEAAWELSQYGVSSITTDVPGIIGKYFKERAGAGRKGRPGQTHEKKSPDF